MFRTTILNAFAAATLAAAPVAAQSLDAKVERNPNDTVTYTIDVDGPPRGYSALMAGFRLSQYPIGIPGWHHQLWLDPSAMLVLTTIPISDLGTGHFDFTVPAASTYGRPIWFQTLNLDQSLTFAFSRNDCRTFHQIVAGQPGGTVSNQCQQR